MVRNVYVQICAAKIFEFCRVGFASMLKSSIRLLLIRIGWFTYSINVVISQNNIFINKATCLGHKRIAYFRPELFFMKICCVD
jgi:hypothetical protein